MSSSFLNDLVLRQITLSKRAFGPGARTAGLCKHIQKELDEISDDPDDVLEWIDVMILGMDGAWRTLRAQFPWMDDNAIAGTVADALKYKIGVNEGRNWPDWREVGEDEPIEHVKAGDHKVGPVSAKAKTETCKHCNGIGWFRCPSGDKPCPVCQTNGKVVISTKAKRLCGVCEGRGSYNSVSQGVSVQKSCPHCGGGGIVG